MNQAEIDKLAESFRAQGLTWAQTNFAVAVVRNAVEAAASAAPAKPVALVPLTMDQIVQRIHEMRPSHWRASDAFWFTNGARWAEGALAAKNGLTLAGGEE